jgi:hypothetical protein
MRRQFKEGGGNYDVAGLIYEKTSRWGLCPEQGDQIGRIFAYWVIASSFGQFFLKICTKVFHYYFAKVKVM